MARRRRAGQHERKTIMIWNKEMECMSVEEKRALQSERLVKLVKYVYDNVEFYRNRMDSRIL